MSHFDHLSKTDYADMRQLCDLDTEEAVADLWTRYGVSLAEARTLLADVRGSAPMPPEEPAYDDLGEGTRKRRKFGLNEGRALPELFEHVA